MTLALVALVIEGGGTGATTLRTRVAVPLPLALMAVSAIEKEPATVGVPLINPLKVFTDSPAGRPLALKRVGELLAAMVYEKAEPLVAVALVALEIAGGGTGAAAMVKARTAEAVPVGPVAERAIENYPATVGVPLITPLDMLAERPAGRPPVL